MVSPSMPPALSSMTILSSVTAIEMTGATSASSAASRALSTSSFSDDQRPF